MSDQSVLEAPAKPKRKLPAHLDRTGQPAHNAIQADWDGARDAIAAGVAMSKVALMFGVPLEALKKRAQRNSWFVPATHAARAKEKLAEKGISLPLSVPDASISRIDREKSLEKTGTLVALSLSEMGEEGSILAGRLSLDLLKQAAANPERIAPIVDSKDIACNIKTLRLVAGMDKQGPVVSLNLWNGPTMSQNVPVTELGDTLSIRLDGGEDQE